MAPRYLDLQLLDIPMINKKAAIIQYYAVLNNRCFKLYTNYNKKIDSTFY